MSPNPSSRFPELVSKVAACRLVLSLLICGAQLALAGGSLGVAQLPQDGRQRGVSAGEIRLQPDGFAQGCGCFLQFALLLQHGAQGVVGLGVVGFGLDGGAQFVRGLIEIALLPQGDSERVVNIGLTGIQFRGFLEFRNRIGQLVFQFQRQPQIVVQSRILRRGFERSLEIA